MSSAVNQGNCPCGSDEHQCLLHFAVNICGLPIAGATVRVWSDATKADLLGSGVTDGSGVAEFGIPVAVGVTTNWYYEASYPSARVGVASGNGACFDDGESAVPGDLGTIEIPPAAHYYCSQWCQFPLFETLHYSDDVLGPVTLFNSGSGAWVGTTSHTFASGTDVNGNTCGGPTLDVTVSANAAVGGGSVGFPRTGAVGTPCTKCAGGGGGDVTCTSSVTSIACPDGEAFLLTFEYGPSVLLPTAPATVSGTLSE